MTAKEHQLQHIHRRYYVFHHKGTDEMHETLGDDNSFSKRHSFVTGRLFLTPDDAEKTIATAAFYDPEWFYVIGVAKVEVDALASMTVAREFAPRQQPSDDDILAAIHRSLASGWESQVDDNAGLVYVTPPREDERVTWAASWKRVTDPSTGTVYVFPHWIMDKRK